MRTGEPRTGIERKILTSILWVGILPMALALLAGYLTAREGQSQAAQQTLATAARRTADGLAVGLEARLRTARKLARDPMVIAAMLPAARGEGGLPGEEQARLEARLRLEAESAEGGWSDISLYDSEGRRVASSHGRQVERTRTAAWPQERDDVRYVDFDYSREDKWYTACIVAPVFDLDASPPVLVGYASELLGINSLFEFVLAHDSRGDARESASDQYQIVYVDAGRSFVAELQGGESPSALRMGRVDERLRERMRSPGGRHAGSVYLSDYQVNGVDTNVFVAYHPLFQMPHGGDVYIAVSRPALAVYATINRGAMLAILGSVLLIAVLCVIAYRNVHSNIARPISLLNEGAQIIRQGDLDLKLIIDTGDEIEELASSFNKMALALSRNIKQLEESEENYRNLVTSMRDGICQMDLNWVITFLNPSGVEIFGYPQASEAPGQNLRELFLEEIDYAQLANDLDNVGFVERSRVWMKRRDGRAICVEISANRMYDDDGVAVGVEGTFRDVTQSVRLEKEARERSERISAINQIANVINSSLEAGRLYDSLVVEVKKLVSFDYAALALLNETGDAVTTRQLWPQLEPGSGQAYRLDETGTFAGWAAQQRHCLCIDDLQASDAPFIKQFPDETRSCLFVPLYAIGRIIGTLNLGANHTFAFSKHDIDVVEQMAPHVAVAIRNAQLLENFQISLEEVTRAREKLHAANEELKTLDEMKTNLLSNVSHELRTPLVAVMGYTDMIFNEKVGPTNKVQKEYLAISLRNIEKLVTLIENLLDFSRLHRGAETLSFDRFDLVDCARASLEIIQPMADSREIELELITPGDELLVEADRSKIGQVFNNLLSNAVKFNHNGGHVRIELRQGDREAEVVVSDTGIGIPAEALDKVFTRFYQYDSSSTRKYGGTGIGLSIAQDIVRMHGSRITVTSEVGTGSAFRFLLPLATSRDVKRAATAEAAITETHLLVELVSQDQALSTQVRALLSSEGMDVIHAANPEYAVSLAQKHSPDCILVDLGASENGRTVLDDLLADPTARNVPIVIMTNDEETYNRYRLKVAARVKRGFRKSTLLSGIHYALSRDEIAAGGFGHRILCVDDDREILEFMCRCLENEGYAVDGCTSGEEAVRRAATRDYRIVLLDIAMPGMDGWAACRRIKSETSLAGIKVYMVTAKPIADIKPRLKECGADGYVLKPFRSEDLVEILQGVEVLQPSQET